MQSSSLQFNPKENSCKAYANLENLLFAGNIVEVDVDA